MGGASKRGKRHKSQVVFLREKTEHKDDRKTSAHIMNKNDQRE